MANNIIDSIQVSGTVYTLSAQTEGGGVPESAFTAYTASTNERISQDEEVTAAALNVLNESLSGKQDTLVSSSNIKTINNESILGSGNITIQGGSSYTAGDGIDITNDVISVTGKVDTDDFNTYSGAVESELDDVDWQLRDRVQYREFNLYTAATESRIAEDEEVTSAGLNALNDKFDGLKLKKISQSSYDNLQVKDPNTLYIILG